MIIKAYDNSNDLLFEMECDSVSPVSSYLIENNLIEEPAHYYDNSLEGYNVRVNTKSTQDDINNFKNLTNLNSEIKDAMLELEINKQTKISSVTLEEASDANISFFSNLYENIKDEYESEFDDCDFLELIF